MAYANLLLKIVRVFWILEDFKLLRLGQQHEYCNSNYETKIEIPKHKRFNQITPVIINGIFCTISIRAVSPKKTYTVKLNTTKTNIYCC
jgi:hypothetical protein